MCEDKTKTFIKDNMEVYYEVTFFKVNLYILFMDYVFYLTLMNQNRHCICSHIFLEL